MSVARLGDTYRVFIFSSGKYQIPIPVGEGWFQKWTDASTFYLKGPGEEVPNGRKYTIGKDATSQGEKYQSGYAILNSESNTLTISAKLNRNFSAEANHSGTYKGFQIQIPVPLEDASNLPSYLNKLVKFTGVMIDEQHCQTKGGTISVGNFYIVARRYEFYGVVRQVPFTNSYWFGTFLAEPRD